MFGNIVNKLKKSVDETEQIADHFYAQVMDEISDGYKDKALVGKAIAQADGNEAKFDSVYVKLRARALQEQFFARQEQLKKEKAQQIEQEQQIKQTQQAEQAEQRAIKNKQLKIVYPKITRKHNNGYFHNLFEEKLKAKGFTVSFFFQTLKKHGVMYYTEIDYENMDFLVVDKNKEILHKFHFETEQ